MVDCGNCIMRKKCMRKGKKCSGISEVPYSKRVRNAWLGLLIAIDELTKRELECIRKGKKHYYDKKYGNMEDTIIPYLNGEYDVCKLYDYYKNLCHCMDVGEIFEFNL